MLGPKLFSKILTNAYNLSDGNILDNQKLLNADEATSRLVKKAEAYFNLLPDKMPTFSHFTPANWLNSNIDILVENDQDATNTLNRFKELFEKLNNFLP